MLYKRVKVREYIPDLIAFGAIVVDAKVVEAITDHERGQMLNYLKITGLKLGLILHFRRANLEWERIILETTRAVRRGASHSRPFVVKLRYFEKRNQPRINANGRK